MPSIFIFDIAQVRHILMGLRKLRDAEPDNADAIDGTICWIKYQMVGKIKLLEPNMRNRRWIEDEIAYEQSQHATEFHDCANEQCKSPCRGKFCVSCWHSLLSEIHGDKEHKAEECKKA